ncbi:MAG: energy transducer TonB [Gammaproteobacteria bacterium]
MSNRVRRACAAGAVLLAHVALVWMIVLIRAPAVDDHRITEPVFATLIDQPRPRNLTIDPVPIRVETENVVHLQRLAPKIQDFPVDEPEPPTTPSTVPMPASAPLPQLADSGMNGDAVESSGESGGGFRVTLLQRVIPKYPVASARRGEEGVTQVMLHVAESGRVNDVKITRGSGSRGLDNAALEAFRKWKFARLPEGAAPDGVWLRTEQCFIQYRLKYSRLGDSAADKVDVAAVQPAKDQVTPGSEEALGRFIKTIGAGTFTDDSDVTERNQVEKMRTALAAWGAVKSIQFTGTAGEHRWMTYRVRPGSTFARPTVEVEWNLFEVRHQNATTEWLIAVDRDGTVWNASASAAPWVQTAKRD